jgi:penicillin-binding protein 1A
MTGGSLPAQTWHDIMVAAHQGVEIKELAGVGMGTKLPPSPASAVMAANGGPRPPEVKPPPVLTKRGADILVRVEKLLDEAAKTTEQPAKPSKPVSSTSAGFNESFASAVPGSPVAPVPSRKN